MNIDLPCPRCGRTQLVIALAIAAILFLLDHKTVLAWGSNQEQTMVEEETEAVRRPGMEVPPESEEPANPELPTLLEIDMESTDQGYVVQLLLNTEAYQYQTYTADSDLFILEFLDPLQYAGPEEFTPQGAPFEKLQVRVLPAMLRLIFSLPEDHPRPAVRGEGNRVRISLEGS